MKSQKIFAPEYSQTRKIKTEKMNKSLLIDRITKELFGRPLTLKSYQAMRNYLQQLDQDQLKEMLKEI